MNNFGPQEIHPYATFFPAGATKLILGSIPPFRFTLSTGDKILKKKDIEFYYGSSNNYFWSLLSNIYEINLDTVEFIKIFLQSRQLGISDIIQKCKRKQTEKGKFSALDKDLKILEYRNLDEILKTDSLQEILFTSQFVANHFHAHIPIPKELRYIVLPSPSGSASRAIGRLNAYKKKKGSNYNTLDYRREKYRQYL